MSAKQRKRRRPNQSATPDLTPMIDVTFQLLIFFILCTRFLKDERRFRANLPDDVGFRELNQPLKEQLTIYCNWDPQRGTNDYVLAIGARGRRAVPGTSATLADIMVLGLDRDGTSQQKRARYRQINDALLNAMKACLADSGARIERLEISFARDASTGASSGTAPWAFVSAAMDAAQRLNNERRDAGQKGLPLQFKFVDALGKYAR